MIDLVRNADPQHLKTLSLPFNDKRLAEMLFRYRARNWPESLAEDETEQWQQYRQQRLTIETTDKILTLPRYFEAIEACRSEKLNQEQLQILTEIEAYGHQLEAAIL